jgi:PBP1b-binding outer membrane lipoprotein LpoB
MKKIKIIALSALAFVTISSLVFVSCHKEQNTPTASKASPKKKTRSFDAPNSNIRSILNSSIFTDRNGLFLTPNLIDELE